jgi:hypothetical protein
MEHQSWAAFHEMLLKILYNSPKDEKCLGAIKAPGNPATYTYRTAECFKI